MPFAGTASEMIGAMLAGWDEIVGIEREQEYVEIAEKRLAYWQQFAGKQASIFDLLDQEDDHGVSTDG